MTKPRTKTSEFAFCVTGISLRCSFEGRDEEPTSGGLVLAFENATLHTISDVEGVTRVAASSLSARLIDESKTRVRTEKATGDMLYKVFPKKVADKLKAGEKVEP